MHGGDDAAEKPQVFDYSSYIRHHRGEWNVHNKVRELEERWFVEPEIAAEREAQPDISPDQQALLRSLLEDASGLFLRERGSSAPLPCFYCGNELSHISDGHCWSQERQANMRKELRTCAKCGWWVYLYRRGYMTDGPAVVWIDTVVVEAVLRTFSVSDHDAPAASLRVHLGMHPGQLASASPKALEALVAGVFRDYLEGVDVHHVGGPGDGGVDLLLVNSKDGSQCLVQIKRRSAVNATEGVRTVRELLGSLVANGAWRGIVVSTARSFSRAAMGLSRIVRDRRVSRHYLRLDLYHRDKLAELLQLTRPKVAAPWQSVWAMDVW